MSEHHHHDHSVDVAELQASSAGMRALGISVAGLAVTGLAQVVVVVASGSVALRSDTIHNFTDALTAVPLAAAFLLARRRPNRRYTYGYGRAEDLAGLAVVAAMAFTALGTARQALERLVEPQTVDHVGWVALAGLVGFAGNELVARYRIHVGRRIGSAVLVADGLHARTDALISLAVVGAAAGSAAGWRHADPVVGLAISLAIVNVLRVAAREICRRLMDRVDAALVDDIEDRLAATPGIQDVERVRARWIGHQLHLDANVVLDGDLPLGHAHQVLEDTRHTLLHQVPRLTDALLHARPAPTPADREGTPVTTRRAG